jgi:hypothetical protein
LAAWDRGKATSSLSSQNDRLEVALPRSHAAKSHAIPYLIAQ